jgi:predicted metal-dependent hydrolase
MSELVIRRIPFEFEGVEFIWNPANPGFSLLMNKVSFFMIALEKYFCQTMRAAEASITDPAVKEELRMFVAQEAAHAAAHRRHIKVLIHRYPGLQEALDVVIQHYDRLYDSRELAYHLGYAAAIESTFTPSVKMLIDGREGFYGKGDARVSSLFLWHFCEEIEHRSSAVMIYEHVVGSYLLRARNFLGYIAHLKQGLALIEQKFKEHVPDVPAHYYEKQTKIGDGLAFVSVADALARPGQGEAAGVLLRVAQVVGAGRRHDPCLRGCASNTG